MSSHIMLDIFHKLKNKVTPIIFVDKSPLSPSPQIFFHKPCPVVSRDENSAVKYPP